MESLRELMELVKDLPGMTLWILGGFLFYKLAITGSVIGALTAVSKLLINKVHDIKSRPVINEELIDVDGYFITGSKQNFLRLIERVCVYRKDLEKESRYTRYSSLGVGKQFLHAHDIEWVEEAIKEKMEKDKLQKEQQT